MLKVEQLYFDDLSEDEKKYGSNNGCGKENATYLKVTHNGEVLTLESDAMEPEDARFYRDLSWIQPMLIRCYDAGKEDAGNA